MTGRKRTLFVKAPLVAVLSLLAMPLFAGRAQAFYPPNGTKPDGSGGWMTPGDGMCVVGVKMDGTMLVDWSITNARDCAAWTKSADSSVNLSSMDTSDKCTKTATVGNDGYKHAWSTSICYDAATSKGISRVDLDNTDTMCLSKGGTVVTTGKCVAYGWVYRNRKADNTLPISGAGLATTDGVQAADGLGFCYASMRMTSATFNSASTCLSYHNSATYAPAEWPACLSSTAGCQTQASYDAGLGWTWDSTNSRCLHAFGIKGILNAAATKADGTTYAAGSTQDLTGYTNQGDCVANGFSWDNWLPSAGTTIKDNTSGGEYAGMPAGAQIIKLDALTPVEGGGGEFYSGTGFNCEKCHTDQSRSYMERNKTGFPKTRHQTAGDDPSKPFQAYFNSVASAWGLQGVICSMCHSTAKPAQDDLIQVVPAGVVGPPAEGAPKSASGHNQTEYGTHLVDLCYHCHGTPAAPPTTNPASVIPVSSGDFALTANGLAPIANQFLNSPHAMYAGSSTKVDVGNKTKYGSTFEGYVCRTAQGKLSSTTYPSSAACTGAGYTWYTTTSNGNFCYYNSASCTALPTGNWTTSYVAASYPWAADTGGPGGVCYGIGIGSIVTTVYRDGSAEKIPNLDTTVNAACTNAGNGSATSGAASFWVKDGETSSGGTPSDTAQGNCMTCHDVHWALADTDPEAEAFRRECTTCHMNSGTSASNAPQIDLTTINHLKTPGTPLENWLTDPDEACETCHMPKSSDAASRMHLWRISTDSTYVTMGTTQANLAPDVAFPYTNAAWVDIDHACGQCHKAGGSAPYRTKAQLAAVAKGMHGSSGVSYPVTFTAAVVPGTLTVNVDATVDCGGACPPGITYDWNWGDGTANGTGDPASHPYATAGAKTITLTVNLNGKLAGSATRSVTLTNPDLPPTVAGTCTWNGNTWTITVVDASTDDGPDANALPGDGEATLKIVYDWGDGTTKSTTPQGASNTHTYGKVGTFTVTQRAIDSKLQTSVRTCDPIKATPAYFAISGTVKNKLGTVNLGAATVQLKSGTTVVRTVSTATNGTFSLETLKPGTYTLVVTKSTYTFAVPAATITVGPSSSGRTINATNK